MGSGAIWPLITNQALTPTLENRHEKNRVSGLLVGFIRRGLRRPVAGAAYGVRA